MAPPRRYVLFSEADQLRIRQLMQELGLEFDEDTADTFLSLIERSPKEAKYGIFLCHSSTDKEFVRRLAEDLHTLAISVWFDEWQMTPGDSLHAKIGAALEASRIVGVVLSPDSVASRWCQDELRQALAREKRVGEKVVVPLLLRRVALPPFLEDKMYLKFGETFDAVYFSAVTKLSGLLHNLDSAVISRRLKKVAPKNIEQVKKILEAAGWNSAKYVSAEIFDRLAALLKVRGNTMRFLDDDGGMHHLK